MRSKDPNVNRRRKVQWYLSPIVIVVIALGWKYPLLGFSVPIVMLMGIIGAFVRGRYVCGHLCPRGGFYDRVMAPISPGRPIPRTFRNAALRWTLVVLLMGFMIWRIIQTPGDVYHWGRVFWLMCTVTTVIGVVLALVIHQRSWCTICPVGTMQNAIGGRKDQLRIDAAECKECRTCEKTCPIDLPIVKHKDSGVVAEGDCLKCPECIAACPANALSWPENADSQTGH